MANGCEPLNEFLRDTPSNSQEQHLRQSIVDYIDQIAEDLLRQARGEEPELSGQFVEGVEALQAAIAAALGVGTKT